MKLEFLAFGQGRAPGWVVEARLAYAGKLGAFAPFAFRTLKSPAVDRASSALKTRREAELLLRDVGDKAYLVLFDERGRPARGSADFAKAMARVLESGKSRAVFVIGGPYGFASEARARADQTWSLSPLTFNHWLAQLVALEQLYRGFAILKGLPYHNE